MEMRKNLALSIRERSQVAEARRAAAVLARNLGFNVTESGRLAIIVTEAAKNLAKFAKGGELLLRTLEEEDRLGLEILSLDRGPGMANVSQCLVDGYSTSGSAGTGLGAISRLCDLFDIYSVAGQGTALVARIWPRSPAGGRPAPNLEIGAVCLPKPGEQANGDGWVVIHQPGRSLILVVDGLGHGPMAGQASFEAIRVFRNNPDLGPARIVEAIHTGLRSTRGAAVAMAEVNPADRVVLYSGVGNIGGFILSSEDKVGLVSYNGTAGVEASKIGEFTYPWPQGAVIIIYSDGLISHWNLDQYPGLLRKHPSLISGVLYRDYSRGNDDLTVLVARQGAA